MKKVTLTVAFLALMICTACSNPIETSSLIVHQNYQTVFGASSGGEFKWVSSDPNGGQFLISFDTPLSCNGPSSDLIGSPKRAARCEIPEDSDGVYRYYLYPLVQDAKGTHRGNRSPALYAHVDGCDGCKASVGQGDGGKKKIKRFQTPPASASTGPIIYLDCKNGSINLDPPSPLLVSAGQVIEWSQVGPVKKVQWSVQPEAICNDVQEGATIGTYGDGTVTCTAAASGSYTATIYDYDSPAGKFVAACSGTAQITLK